MRNTILFLLTIVLALQLWGQERGVRKSPSGIQGEEFVPYRKKFGLVVGIDNYPVGVKQLNYAVADARAIRQMLLDSLRYDDVIILENEKASRVGILDAITDLGTKLDEQDQLFFYFGGHGESYGDGSQEMGFLLPQDIKDQDQKSVSSGGISMSDLRERLVKLAAKHVLICVDACYGGYAAVGTSRSLSRETEDYVRKITTFHARQLITAGKRGEVVYENSDWGHSALVKMILEGVGKKLADADHNGIITVNELFPFLQSYVTSLTLGKQTPQSARLSDDEGEFTFILNNGPGRFLRSSNADNAQLGDMFIKSDPDSAEIYLDGMKTNKTTPAEFTEITEGSHILELKKNILVAKETVLVHSNQINKFDNISLHIGRGSIKISSTPFEANVFVAGDPRGKTPLLISDIAAGTVEVILKKEGYLDYAEKAEIRPSETQTLSGKLIRPSSLTITSNPSGAAFFIDKELMGKTPYVLKNLKPGTLNISLSMPGFSSTEEEVHVQEGTDRTIEKILGTVPTGGSGDLSISNIPPDASVYLSGVGLIGKGPLTHVKVPLKISRVKVEDPEFGSIESDEMDIQQRGTVSLRGSFGNSSWSAVWRSMIIPGWGQVNDKEWRTGAVYFVGAVGAGVFALVAHSTFDTRNNDYQDARNRYLQSTDNNEAARLAGEMATRYSDVDKARNVEHIATYLVAGIYALNVLDAYVFHSKQHALEIEKEQYHSINVVPIIYDVNSSMQYGVMVRF